MASKAERVLSGFLEQTSLPLGQYVPAPRGALHALDARTKQAWLFGAVLLQASAGPAARVGVAAALALATAAALPPRLSRAQLTQVGALSLLVLVLAALGADSVAPLGNARLPDAGVLDALPALPPPEGGYSYTLLDVPGLPLAVTRRGARLAVASGALTFTVLQGANLWLSTTPPEAVAASIRWYLAPLRLVGAPVDEMALTLLLSLRFVALVFEEARNIAMAVLARGLDWRALGTNGAAEVAGGALSRLADNLFAASEQVAQAMVARGYRSPESQTLYLGLDDDALLSENRGAQAVVANVLAIAAFFALALGVRELGVLYD